MSRVILIAADKPLPLYDCRTMRSTAVNGVTITALRGFQISEHQYYRNAVDELGYPIKAYQYELELCLDETDLSHLRSYLQDTFSSGETADFWRIWVGDVTQPRPPHFCGTLEAFDMDTMKQFFEQEGCWLSITI